jgi:hypothetical protein
MTEGCRSNPEATVNQRRGGNYVYLRDGVAEENGPRAYHDQNSEREHYKQIAGRLHDDQTGELSTTPVLPSDPAAILWRMVVI